MILFTSPEAQLLFSAATNAKRFEIQEQAERLTYKTEGLPGLVVIQCERGEDLAVLAERVKAIHPDAAQVIAFITSELIGDPREALPKGKTPVGSFALSRIVQEAMGIDPWKVTKSKREELLLRVAEALWFAERARVECSRPGVFDMGGGHRETLKIAAACLTGQRLDTEAGAVPRVVECALSSQWLCPLTGSRAQYLPVGDAFSKLSSGRAKGAWARSIALWFVSQCRIHREDALAGTMKPVTPGEILKRFGVGDTMPSASNGCRVLSAWSEALTELAEVGLIAPHPDADPKALRERLGTIAGARGGSPLLSIPAPSLAPGPVLIVALEALNKTGDPLKLTSQTPKTDELTPENGRADRGQLSLNRKEQSTAGVPPEVVTPSAVPFVRRPRPCPVCGDHGKPKAQGARGDNPTSDRREQRNRKGGS